MTVVALQFVFYERGAVVFICFLLFRFISGQSLQKRERNLGYDVNMVIMHTSGKFNSVFFSNYGYCLSQTHMKEISKW